MTVDPSTHGCGASAFCTLFGVGVTPVGAFGADRLTGGAALGVRSYFGEGRGAIFDFGADARTIFDAAGR